MPLTPAQLQAIKADVISATDQAMQDLEADPGNSDKAFPVADLYNTLISPDWFAWNPRTPVEDIFNQVTWANFTPQDTPDITTLWTNNSLACQGKQFNLQTMLVGRQFFDASRQAQRTGLQDAATNLPSGPGGATKSGGWLNIQPILSRKVTRLEKLLSSGGSGTVAVPTTMGFAGNVSYQDIMAAMAS